MTTLTLQFAGGSHVVLGKRQMTVEVKRDNEDEPLTVSGLLKWMRETMLVDCARPELLIDGDTVRPGILVVINDKDWEILGGLDAVLKSGDDVTFLSTLHGG